MKKQFFDYMRTIMDTQFDVYLILCGLGYPRVEEFLANYPDRAINVEASEQSALDIAVGLAYAGKTPLVYTITPFLYRGFETIRTYIDREKLNIKLVGVGRNDDYSKHDGYSHFAGDDFYILDQFENLNCRWPDSEEQLQNTIQEALKSSNPYYINIKR